ncbi:MAG: NfeD family protein [Sphingorhabdus sp.]
MDWLEQATGLDTGYLWLIGAVVLGGLELLLPGIFLVWIAIAAALTGIATVFLDIPVIGQLVLFSLLAVAAVYSARKSYRAIGNSSADPMLNDRGARLTGEIVTVVEAIQNGTGRVKVGDGVWSARGADAGVGDKVRVTGSDGTVLLVEAI